MKQDALDFLESHKKREYTHDKHSIDCECVEYVPLTSAKLAIDIALDNGEENIKYTRTDAFIEKAKVWLKKNAYKYIWYSDYAESPGDDTCGMNDDFVKDFANYLNGE